MSQATSEMKVMNRWWVVVGALLIQLCLGAIYAWSAFTGKLTAETGDYGFTKTQTQVIFGVGLATFAVVMAFVAGKWQKKAGPRTVAITGGIVLGLGYLLAGFSGSNFWGILLGIGVLGGAGIGLGYVCPIAALVKWFPDKKGMITGLAVAGFGFGALIWIKLTSGFIFGTVNIFGDWKGLYGMGWTVNQVWQLYGVVFAVVVFLGSLVTVNPPEGWLPAGFHPEAAGASKEGRVNYTASEMGKTFQFWTLFLTFTAGALAGLMVIGVIGLFGKDQLAKAGMSADRAAVVVATAMGVFYALMNGLGRIIWGVVSDKIGRKAAIILMAASQGVMMLLFYKIGGYQWGLYLGAAIIGFNFGGNFALFPAATADFFGNKNVGTNYPWVFMAYGVGGIVGPILAGIMGDRQLWFWAFIPAGIACLVVAGLSTTLKPLPTKVHAEEPLQEEAIAEDGAWPHSHKQKDQH